SSWSAMAASFREQSPSCNRRAGPSPRRSAPASGPVVLGLRPLGAPTMTRPMKLLVVEDNPDDVALIRDKLGRVHSPQPFEIESVGGLAEAVKRLGNRDIDVVLLDLNLPDSGGTDGVAQIDTRAPGVPVVVLTGLDDVAVGLRAVQEGAQDYLIKDR